MEVPLHSTGDASCRAALLLPRIFPIFLVVAPSPTGASPVSVRRGTSAVRPRARYANCASDNLIGAGAQCSVHGSLEGNCDRRGSVKRPSSSVPRRSPRSDRIDGSPRNRGTSKRSAAMAGVADIRVGRRAGRFRARRRRASTRLARISSAIRAASISPRSIRRSTDLTPPPLTRNGVKALLRAFDSRSRYRGRLPTNESCGRRTNHSSRFWLRPTAWLTNEVRCSCSCRRRCRLTVQW